MRKGVFAQSDGHIYEMLGIAGGRLVCRYKSFCGTEAFE